MANCEVCGKWAGIGREKHDYDCSVQTERGPDFLAGTAPSQPDVNVSRYGVAVINRYRQAYSRAGLINSFGGVVKVMALVIGGLIAVSGFISCASSAGNSFGGGIGVVVGGSSFVIGIIFGFLGYAFGALIQSVGQQLMAQLDTAVNGSPFLTEDQKAGAMSLR